MKHKANIRFIGREVGAIGITFEQEKIVEYELQPGDNAWDKAVLKLYDTHEHISVISVGYAK